MKLNKLQRHTAYIIMLSEAETDLPVYCREGLCNMINILFGMKNKLLILRMRNIDLVIKENFPELFGKKPSWCSDDEVWFDCDDEGWRERIQILKQCIKETA